MRRTIDISRELFSCPPYPGDPAPRKSKVRDVGKDGYSLTAFYACAHNGTHVDAPCHFLENGCDVSEIPLDKCMGKCVVVSDAASALKAAARGYERILLRGCDVDQEQAAALVGSVVLLGMDAPSFGESSGSGGAVHRTLLGAGVVLLENLDLTDVKDGEYELIALPLRLAGSDGSPVRAVLIENE